jgi:hypothetical protein
MSDTPRKRVVTNLDDYTYGQFVSNLKYESVNHPARVVRYFIEAYVSGDQNARNIVSQYKVKNKVAGRGKKELVDKAENASKKTETLYGLSEEEIEDIYDILDETIL